MDLQPKDPRHTRDEVCPICVGYAKMETCGLAPRVVERRSSALGPDLTIAGGEAIRAHQAMVEEVERQGMTHATFKCPGCKEEETYPLTQGAAREVAKRHWSCKKGRRRAAKNRLTAGMFRLTRA